MTICTSLQTLYPVKLHDKSLSIARLFETAKLFVRYTLKISTFTYLSEYQYITLQKALNLKNQTPFMAQLRPHRRAVGAQPHCEAGFFALRLRLDLTAVNIQSQKRDKMPIEK